MRHLWLLSAITLLATPAIAAAEDEPAASEIKLESIELDPREFGDPLADVFDIVTVKGRYRLSQPATEVGLRVDVYHKGKKVDSFSADYGTIPSQASAEGRFAVHVVDLDQVPLGDAKPGHYRVKRSLEIGNGDIASNHTDVPKTLFNFAHGRGMQQLAAKPASNGEATIYYFLGAPKGSTIAGASTPEGVLKDNPDADVLMITLEFGNEKPADAPKE